MKYIPWHNTQSLAKGIEGLNRMYRSLQEDSALKLFLDKHCLHLLKPLQGDTGIPIDYTDTRVLEQLPDVINLEGEFKPEPFSNLPGQVGVYVFFSPKFKRPTQCGSSIAFFNRMRSYYVTSSQSIFEQYHIADFLWVPVKYCSNYIRMFNKNNQMTSKQEVILLSFMQQEIRSVEQAYTTYAEPSNYKNIQISTWHNNWHEDSIGHTYASKRINWITKDGTIYTRSSIDTGVLELGYSRKHVINVAKREGGLLQTEKYGEVTVHIHGVEKNISFDKRYGTPINTFVDTTSFKSNYIYLYDKDMSPLPFGPYSNVRVANLAIGLKDNYSGTHLWTNYMHLIYAPALETFVYIVKGNGQSMPVLLESVTNRTITEYPSVSLALKVVASGKMNDDKVLRCIVQGKPISYKKGPSYIIRFKRSEDQDSAVQRYLAKGYKL